ncbi:MAG TPA: nicotianamine synthase family protein [Archangium sp.]|nr:nicotianamine synthase family protein [Archangium sp.]
MLTPGRDELPTRIHHIDQQLATAPSLEPTEEVSRLFRELVGISISPLHAAEASRVLADPILDAIRENLWRVCSRGEYALERQWAIRALEAAQPWEELRRFPYYANYEKLTRLEFNSLRGASEEPPRRVLFVGSGPLPLTSILLAHRYGLHVSNLEIDEHAWRISRELSRRLGLEERMVYQRADVLSCSDLAGYDCVFLAALVGMSRREKVRLLRHLAEHMRPGALLLVRSSQRLRGLLYPEVDVSHLGSFIPRMELHPHDEVVNSVIIAERPASAPVA